MLPTVHEAAARLREGRLRAADLLEQALSNAREPAAKSVYLRFDESRARAQLERRGGGHSSGGSSAEGRSRAASPAASVLDGVPISIKDLFDIAGEVTTAGSTVLASAPAANADAPVIARLRAAGALLIGRSNMTEFAFSGLGVNPHYGTPLNPFEPCEQRIPGGSSSGAAISVTSGTAVAAIGTDTGGSVRIPAALCGLVGFKPTASRVPLQGAFALSPSLDSIGPIAQTVRCCAAIDAILAADASSEPAAVSASSLTLGVARTLVWDEIDPHVEKCVTEARRALERAGVKVVDCVLPSLKEIVSANSTGGITALEAFRIHEDLLRDHAGEYDPRVRVRIERGAGKTDADRDRLLQERARIQSAFAKELPRVDAWVMPTVPRIAPRLSDLVTDDAYTDANRLMLRNTSLVNYLDGCAISLPCHPPGSAPVGISLAGARGADRQLLAIAQTVESIVKVA
jgi:aspartyl-tRNA(Asn)/glutamyl-tRNA(Gln) amidotransferase subunit A